METRTTVKLKSDGELVIELEFNSLMASKEDREFIEDIASLLDDYLGKVPTDGNGKE